MRYPFVIISAGLTRIAEARDAGQLTNHVDKVLSLTGVCPAHEMCAAALRRPGKIVVVVDA
jgi:hypothetical protein